MRDFCAPIFWTAQRSAVKSALLDLFKSRYSFTNMKNPFLQRECPPNWGLMKADCALDDVKKAISTAKSNIESIKSQKTPTYENTIRALDRATMDAKRVWTDVNHLESVADTDELRCAVNAAMPLVSEFYSSIPLDSGLYARVADYAKTGEALSLKGSGRRLLDETILDFELNGAGLSADKKKRLSQIETRLSLATQKFSENVLDDTKRFFLHLKDKSELSGLPDNAVKTAAKKAAERNLDGWVFTLEQPSFVPFMTYADSDALRERLWRASARLASDGEFSNWNLIREILSLRQEKAEILSRANFADVVLCRRMARDGKTAMKFVEDLHAKFKRPFEAEWKALLNFARSQNLADSDGLIPPWRVAYVSEKFRKNKYDFDPESLRDYFPMDSVLNGLFEICRRLFGIKVSKSELDCLAWDSSVEMFEMRSESGGLMGYFYTDFTPRKSKRAGAWMNLLSPRDAETPALGVIAGNLSEPLDGKPALLSYDDVLTLFHEFGHLIHFFAMDSSEIGLRNVAWDFVELPSQIMENWCRDKTALDLFARHWKTGEKIPEDLYAKFKKSLKFMGANAAMRQLSFAKIDLEMHMSAAKFAAAEDINGLALDVLKGYMHKYSVVPPVILPRFTHLFGDSVGYAAGYYSYKWAEVLDADAFTRFEREGIFNSATGREFAEKILRVGNEIPPEKAFENFMSRGPDVSALVERSVDFADSDVYGGECAC